MKKLKRLINKYARILKVSRLWKVRLIPNKNIAEYAQINYDKEFKELDFLINEKLNKKEEDLKDSIIHELWHVNLINLIDYTRNTLKFIEENPDNIKKLKFKKIYNKLYSLEEKLVIKLTKVIMDLTKEE